MNRQTTIGLFKAIAYIGIYGGLLMPLVFIPIVIFPFVFSKLIMFQILIGVTFPAYLALAWMEPAYRPPKSALYIAIAAYFGAILLSVIFSIDPNRSWWGNQERMNGMFTLLHFFAWLTMAIGVMKRWEAWKKLLHFEVVLSVFMAMSSILQKPYPNLLSFQAGDRPGGLLDNPIYMGTYQIFNLSFIALLFLKTKNKGTRIWLGIAALIDLAAFFIAESRGALFGLFGTVGIFALYYAFFTKSKRARWSILGGAAGAFGLYILAYLFRASSFIASNSILSRLTNLQATTSTRLIAWEIAWKGFLERPLTGWGFDAFYALFNLKYNPKSLEFGYYETWFDRAHNTIMDVLSMTGLFGLITYLAIFIILIVIVWRAHKKGWIDLPIAAILVALPAGYFLQNLFVFDHPAAFSMSYLLFALVISATRPLFIGQRDESSAEQHSSQKSHDAPWILFSLLQIMLLVVVWNCSIRPFRASIMAIRANNALSGGAIVQGADLMKQSLSISTLYDGEQAFLLSRDVISLVDAGAFTKEPTWKDVYAFTKQVNENYLTKHPHDTNQLFIQARLVNSVFPLMTQEEAGKEAAVAEQYYLKAIETSPERQQLYYAFARFYSQTGQPQKTEEILKKAAEFDENVGESWWYLGLVHMLDMGKVNEGAQEIVKSQTVKVPFQLATVSDAVQVARAAAVLKDASALRALFIKLPELNKGGSIAAYIDIARSMETAGLLAERNIILSALTKADAAITAQLEPVLSGKVATIDASLALASSTKIQPPSPSTNESVSSTPLAPTSTSRATSENKLATSSANAKK